MINGNTSGLKEYILENLDKLYSTKIEKGKIIKDVSFNLLMFSLSKIEPPPVAITQSFFKDSCKIISLSKSLK